ncbi:MAG: hypothetical protein FWC65_06380, partial [Treponema sp.]|nr:hypothetical protein [Treponema sp.]
HRLTTGGVARLGDVRINDGATLTLTGDVAQRDGSTLTIGQGASGVLNTGVPVNAGPAEGSSWTVAGNAALTDSYTFTINNTGALVFNEGAVIRTNHFVIPNAVSPSLFTITFAGALPDARVYARGNVSIGDNVARDLPGPVFLAPGAAAHDLDFFTLVMNGHGAPVGAAPHQSISIGSNSAIGSLSLVGAVGAVTNAAVTTDIEIRGNVLIPPNTTLRAGITLPDTIRIHVAGYYGAPFTPQPSRGARWFQTANLGTETGAGGTFVPNSGTVEFGRHGDFTAAPLGGAGRTFRIAGNTTWYNFVSHEPMADILFSNHPHEHKVSSWFRIYPRDAFGLLDQTQARMINLSRLTDTGLVPFTDASSDWIPPSSPNNDFWVLELQPGSRLDLDHVFLYYNWASRAIPLPIGEEADFLVIATPYYSSEQWSSFPALGNVRFMPSLDTFYHYSYFNVNWFVTDEFFYAFTEDSTGSGRIDRIRIQAAFDIMGVNDVFEGVPAFSQFEIEVEGFTIDTSLRGGAYNGIQRVDELTGDLNDRNSIYVWLNPRSYSDGNATPRWRVVRNGSLRDNITGAILMGLSNPDWRPTFDTVPPRINYALAVPGHSEIYIRMSEPVSSLDFVTLGPVLGGGAISPLSGGREFLITGVAPFTLEELASGTHFFQIENVGDGTPFVPDLRNNPYTDNPYTFMLPSPRVPVDWGYSGYVEVRGWYVTGSTNVPFQTIPAGPLPPTREWYTGGGSPAVMGNLMCPDAHDSNMLGVYGSGKHRVTDLLISVPPATVNDAYYFVWPLWARYDSAPAPDDTLGWGVDRPTLPPQGGFMGPGGLTDTTIIWDFTGRRFLELDDITMQFRRNNLLGTPVGITNVELVFGSGVPSGNKSDA